MRRTLLILLCLGAVASGCRNDRRYPFAGQVLAVNVERQELTVKHGDIRGFMPGMTMPFKVRNAADVAAARPGDLISATLVVEDSLGYLVDIKKTGEGPLPADMPQAPRALTIERGADVPDAAFLDQDGVKRRLSDWRGQTVAVTFVYTRCPLPDFCPMMDRHFAAAQRALAAQADLAARVHLLSVTFDPDHDTPPVLKRHAARVGAVPATWSYLTGTRQEIDTFAAVFGVTIMREDGTVGEIVHNLRTAVIDRHGRLVTVLNGSDWTPDQLLKEIRAADAAR
jgi:protein SCO1